MRRGEKLNGRRVERGSREGLENPGSYCRSGGRVRERREKALDLESELDPPPFLATPSSLPSLQISKRVLDESHFLSSSFLPPPGLRPHPSVLRSLYPRKGVSGFARLPRTLLPFPLPRSHRQRLQPAQTAFLRKRGTYTHPHSSFSGLSSLLCNG